MTFVSVCMATFNGSAFVHEQITSILVQLGAQDELIIVDDASTDNTVEIIQSIADLRIRLYANSQNQGINPTFERALCAARGAFLFLSDQDDIWIAGRLNLMTQTLQDSGVDLVVSNFYWIDAHRNRLGDKTVPRLRAADSGSHWRNITKVMLGRANYYGCAMAMRADFRDFTMPVSTCGVGHDEWLAIAANIRGSIHHIEADTLEHRLHSMNASVVQRPLHQKLYTRLKFGMLIFRAFRQKWQANRAKL